MEKEIVRDTDKKIESNGSYVYWLVFKTRSFRTSILFWIHVTVAVGLA